MAANEKNFQAELDLSPTIKFYTQHETVLTERLTQLIEAARGNPIELKHVSPHLHIGDRHHRPLDGWRIRDCVRLFPDAALGRLQWISLIVRGMTWFASDSQPRAIRVTEQLRQALAPTAIVAADSSHLIDGRNLRSTIFLHHLDHGRSWRWGDRVADIVTTQAIVREVAYTLSVTTWIQPEQVLALPYRGFVRGRDLILEFGHLVQSLGCGPISHHSSTCWKEGGSLLVLNPEAHGDEGERQEAIHQELAETIAARLLGFAFCESVAKRGGLSLDPFADRPAVAEWVDQFLKATVPRDPPFVPKADLG